MRRCLYSITILVIVLVSSGSAGQETSKRHITSNPDENRTAPKVGPALRPHSVEPVSHKLRAQINGTVEVGGRLSLEVSLSEESGTITSCEWTSPPGDVIQVYQDEGSKSCVLTLEKLEEDDFGNWKCKISHSASELYQEVYITVTPDGNSAYIRLPKHAKPEEYEVYLTPFIEIDNFTIQGHVDILVNIVEDGAKNVTLHIDKLQIFENTVTVVGQDKNQLQIEGFAYDEERNFFSILLAENLKQGEKVQVSIDYLGELNSDLTGFYRSSYFDEEKNQTEYLALTQFEVTSARRAIPCFDEPQLKAKFKVNLGRLSDMNSISNMPTEYEGVPMADNDLYLWDMYQTSPIMSTYLLAFVISRLSYKQSETLSNGVQLRVWTRKPFIEQTNLAGLIGPQMLEFYEKHYNVNYPLPKMDLVAVPDFSAEAMENWGLITFRETSLLFKEGDTSISEKEIIVKTLAHEMAHQWFGNLVTMEWWTDLWLNEGFAFYMQYLGAHHVQNNDTGIVDQFVVSVLQSAMDRDSVLTSHPVSVPVNHPLEILEIFDEISYNKGGAIIRMMANFLGVDVFNQGIEHYLKEHKYGNAKQDDLWKSLTETAHKLGGLAKGLNLKDIMDTWTLKMGFPVITVKRNYEETSEQITFTQERFLVSEGPLTPDVEPFRWWVPISYTTPELGFEDTRNRFWMSPDQETKTVFLNETLASDQSLIVNVQQTGFYRVNYDSENWSRISAALLKDHKAIHRTNRAQIIDDSLSLAKVGLLDYPIALGTTEYLSNEFDYIPWSAAINEFGYIGEMLGRTEGDSAYKKFIIGQLLSLYQYLGFETKETDNTRDLLLRSAVISTMCELGHDDCEEKAIELFRSWRNQDTSDENSQPVDLRSTIYCTAIGKGGEEDWNFLWARYLADLDSPAEKNNILTALTCSKDTAVLQNLLEMTLNSTSTIKKQDILSVITGVALNKEGRDLAWDWIRSNWVTLSRDLSSSSLNFIELIISSCTSDFNEESKLNELELFYEEHLLELGTGKLATETAIQKAKANMEWMKNYYNQIVDWLHSKNEEKSY